ncbi:hypothetical protein P5V15_007653 [Pogonomyrmex californicus]
MKRTKSKAVNSALSNKKNIGIQTENFNNCTNCTNYFIKIAKLEELLQLMQLENNVLRKHMESNVPDDIHHKSLHLAQQAISKSAEKSGCGCKGNCSSRICGCMKKNNKCNLSCRCDDEKCQNQKSNYIQENKENVKIKDMETFKTPNTKKNKDKEKLKSNKGLFSPDIKEIYNDLEEMQFSDINFSFEKDTMIKDFQTDSDIITINIKHKKEKKKKESNEQQESIEKIQNVKDGRINDNQLLFDPMKPRYQLSRTPPNSKKLEKPQEPENTIQRRLYSKSNEEIAISPEIREY